MPLPDNAPRNDRPRKGQPDANGQPDADRLPRFLLGQIVATPTALSALVCLNLSPWTLLNRHLQGDWGDLGKHDQQKNERALVEGTRLLSAYTLADGTRIWIITEADRSATTLMLPEEY